MSQGTHARLRELIDLEEKYRQAEKEFNEAGGDYGYYSLCSRYGVYRNIIEVAEAEMRRMRPEIEKSLMEGETFDSIVDDFYEPEKVE